MATDGKRDRASSFTADSLARIAQSLLALGAEFQALSKRAGELGPDASVEADGGKGVYEALDVTSKLAGRLGGVILNRQMAKLEDAPDGEPEEPAAETPKKPRVRK